MQPNIEILKHGCRGLVCLGDWNSQGFFNVKPVGTLESSLACVRGV